jgi:hypothetical protein
MGGGPQLLGDNAAGACLVEALLCFAKIGNGVCEVG